MIPVVLTCLLGAGVMAIVYRLAYAKAFVRGVDMSMNAMNAHLDRALPAAIDAAKRAGLRQGADNAAKLLLPLLAENGLEIDAIRLLTATRDELAAKGEPN